eukprot:COSAG06_NODE_60936_length_269_cov_0.629412_1_plen_81_part_10
MSDTELCLLDLNANLSSSSSSSWQRALAEAGGGGETASGAAAEEEGDSSLIEVRTRVLPPPQLFMLKQYIIFLRPAREKHL